MFNSFLRTFKISYICIILQFQGNVLVSQKQQFSKNHYKFYSTRIKYMKEHLKKSNFQSDKNVLQRRKSIK